jgi:hypothetical protein
MKETSLRKRAYFPLLLLVLASGLCLVATGGFGLRFHWFSDFVCGTMGFSGTFMTLISVALLAVYMMDLKT